MDTNLPPTPEKSGTVAWLLFYQPQFDTYMYTHVFNVLAIIPVEKTTPLTKRRTQP